MKIGIGIITVGLLLVGGFYIVNNYIYQEKQADEVVSEAPERDVYLAQFTDEVTGLTFDYPAGADGYVLDDTTAARSTEAPEAGLVQAYRIMNAKEKVELENSQVGREGPPVIEVLVFQNQDNLSARAWVDTVPMFSNIALLQGDISTDAMVAGEPAVRYTTDGLYLTDTIVIAKGDYVYQVTGSYLEVGSAIQQDFTGLVDSLRFTPSANADATGGAKLDVRVVCESALAYMLFETGAQAEQFVAECVAGEHPDVIERYINDLGLDGATI